MSETNELKYNQVLSEISDIDSQFIPFREKYIGLKRILERNLKELTKTEILQFPSLFSRIVFISQKYNLPKSLEWHMQNIRVEATKLIKNKEIQISEAKYIVAKNEIILFISAIYRHERVGGESVEKWDTEKISSLPDSIRVQLISINKEDELLTCLADLSGEREIIISYNVPNINDLFNPTISQLWINAQLNLINSTIDEKTGYVIPRYIVLEPDYLIDASSLAECFQNYGKSHLHYFRKKFEPNSNSKHILLGNLANFFLDELVYAENPEELQFSDIFLKAFKQSPFEYTSCSEIKEKNDFLEFMSKARTQFENIKRVVINDFPANGIHTKQCTLEPSFFCEKFGFQGRLDLLQLSSNEFETDKIIELKSGGLPYPKNDPTKIAINHETQTAIYRLIIQSVFEKKARDISSAILYSAAENEGENIRLSAPFQSLEKEIINIRNLIVANEHYLYVGETQSVDNIFNQLFNLDNYGQVPLFFVEKLTAFEKVINNITTLEREYFFRHISFISRELYLLKSGDDEFESNSSTSALWNSQFVERQESYDLISDLEIDEIDDSHEDMKIKFRRTADSNFVNFREGEICIVYPHTSDEDTVLTNQILKGTIAYISHTEVLVRFRYKQKNKDYLSKHKYWAIEHDRLDHSYSSMFKSLYQFLTSPIQKRSLVLGLEKPRSTISENIEDNPSYLSPAEKQERIIDKAIAAQDYFLIVGPPGTGKTSIFARRLIELFYLNPDYNILVIAYTNRAVDELCEAINNAFGCENGECSNYIRIGTELSCNDLYKHRLLQNVSKGAKSREELRSILYKQRIYVGTLASISGKPELFDMKKFDVAIIDEASQILEPQIIGLLPKFEKWIMIGDHKQLSTITLQDSYKSKVTNVNLNNIELSDCKESYFERIFRICQKNGWTNVYDTLTYQGRMHEDIANFPNRHFYNNMLLPISSWQEEPLSYDNAIKSDQYQELISEKRMAFIPCNQSNNNVLSDKINEQEAGIAVFIAKAIIEVYKQDDRAFDNRKSLGIITPYRNQIALIKHKLEESAIPELQDIMVDTVERYQGSQRDIIIVSFCINKPYQLDFFSNWNMDKTVDRKLNVALTRARQQIFLIGNEYILSQNALYRKLIECYGVYNISI